MVNYKTAIVLRATWHTLADGMRSWAKAYVEASAALVTLLVSDNILAFTRGPYYQPLLYGGFAVVVIVSAAARKKKWYPRLRKLVLQSSAWILSTIAVILLAFAQNDVYFFNGVKLSSYNLLVTIALLFLLLLPTPFIMISDLNRDFDTRFKNVRQKRVPTIFDDRYIVDEKQSLFDRIVAALQD